MLFLTALALFSPNGFWPTGIFNPHCPGQYEYVLEPGHVWLGCWGQRSLE